MCIAIYDIAVQLREHGQHTMLSYLSSHYVPWTQANRFYDRNHQMYDAALLTRCYTQHALRSHTHELKPRHATSSYEL